MTTDEQWVLVEVIYYGFAKTIELEMD